MKLTNRNLALLASALGVFDGERTPILDKDRNVVGSDLVMPKVAWRVTYAVARTRQAMTAALDAAKAARNSVIAKYSGGAGKIEESNVQYAAAQQELEQIDHAEVDVELHKVKLEDLDLSSNPRIGGSILFGLLPWLIDDKA